LAFFSRSYLKLRQLGSIIIWYEKVVNRSLNYALTLLLLISGAGMSISVSGADLRRGPFLQIATPNSITICWRTDVATDSVVRYGTQSNLLASFATDLTRSKDHVVRLSGLKPSTQYFYSIGSSFQMLAGGPGFNFVTHPPVGQAQPTRIWVIGDPGQSPDDGQVRVRNAYYKFAGTRRTDVWLTLGDNAYFYMDDGEYQTNFFGVYPELFKQTAIWPTIGNHETWSVVPGQRMPYLDIFTLPTKGEAGGAPSGREEYYSFDYANIHFISLDSMTQNRTTNGPMATWLRADLAARTNEWLIAFWHHPPYSKGSHDSDDLWEPEMIQMRENIVPILEAGGVDLVLNGHSHTYERSYLLGGHYGDSKTLKPEMIRDEGSGRENDSGAYIKPPTTTGENPGTVYVEAGCAGSAVEPYGHHPAMYFDKQRRGSLVLDVNGHRLDAAFLNDAGVIDDSFTLVKGPAEQVRVVDIILRDGKVILRWKSIAGQHYRIERTGTEQDQTWRAFSPILTATGATTSWTNTAPRNPMNFYRVVQIPPLPLPAESANPP